MDHEYDHGPGLSLRYLRPVDRLSTHQHLKLHHCAENGLAGVALKTVSIEFIYLVTICKNAVSGVVEAVDVGDAVASAVHENLAVIFIE